MSKVFVKSNYAYIAYNSLEPVILPDRVSFTKVRHKQHQTNRRKPTIYVYQMSNKIKGGLKSFIKGNLNHVNKKP